MPTWLGDKIIYLLYNFIRANFIEIVVPDVHKDHEVKGRNFAEHKPSI